MLPDITGEETCQESKELGDFPVIMMTSNPAEEERVAGFALGADDYVVSLSARVNLYTGSGQS